MLNLFNYSDYRSFLNCYVEDRRKASKSFSLGQWSKKMDLSGPAVLTNILTGRRIPSPDTELRLIQYFGFDNKESEYFSDLIRLKKVETEPRLAVALMEKMARYHPRGKFLLLNESQFQSFAHWQAYAIREWVRRQDFKEDEEYLSKNLQFSISPNEVKKTIRNLIEAGLLVRDDSGRLQCAHLDIRTTDGVLSTAIQSFHKESLDNAKIALERLSVEDRDFSARIFNCQVSDLPQIKQTIREFRQKLSDLFEVECGDTTVQVMIQLFPLTKIHSKTKNQENRNES